MTVIHLVRHGETVWHHDNRYAGSSDVALTARGRAQAVTLAEWATGAGLTRIVSSDLSRARITAAPSAEATGLTAEVLPGLREVHFGRGEGRTSAEMAVEFPEALTAFRAAPATSPLPEAERGVDAAERGLATLATLCAPGAESDVVLVVAHSTLIRLVLCRLLGIDPDDYRRRFPSLSNVAVTTVELPQVTEAAELNGAAALRVFNLPTG